jgi:hypothetical protein
VAPQEHVEEVRANGLVVRCALQGDIVVHPRVLAISDLQNNETLFDYCIIAVKSCPSLLHSLVSVSPETKRYLVSGLSLLSLRSHALARR